MMNIGSDAVRVYARDALGLNNADDRQPRVSEGDSRKRFLSSNSNRSNGEENGHHGDTSPHTVTDHTELLRASSILEKAIVRLWDGYRQMNRRPFVSWLPSLALRTTLHWGFVPADYIVGRVALRWWPLEDARRF